MTVTDSGRILDIAHALRFVTAKKNSTGSAVFTLVSGKTGTRFTYRVTSPKKTREDAKGKTLFVSVLTGSDNTNDYSYTGTLWQPEDGRPFYFRHTKGSKVTAAAPSAQAFTFFWKEANKPAGFRAANLLDKVEFWHEGKCGRCNRRLTDPSSIASGFGPECITHVGG